jgi:hypothetical protein
MRVFVSSFDLATTTGGVDGFPSGNAPPRFWTWDLKDFTGQAKRFAEFGVWCRNYFAELREAIGTCPVHVYYEAPLSIQAIISMARHGDARWLNDHTIAILRGLPAILEEHAFEAGCRTIVPVPVAAARTEILGRRKGKGRIPKDQGKILVRAKCEAMGWPIRNLDEADGAAIWAYGCAQSAPDVDRRWKSEEFLEALPLFAATR